MLFLGRSSCEDLKCNYNQKKRLLDRPVPRRFFVHSFAPSLVLFTVHMPLILPLSVFSRKTLSPLFDKSHPVCLFSCFFSVSRKSRRFEITKRADIWSLCVFSRWNVEGICFNCRYDLAAAKMYFFVCHRNIIWTNIPFSQIQYTRALTFGDMTTIACPKMIICDCCLQDSGSALIQCKAFFLTQC